MFTIKKWILACVCAFLAATSIFTFKTTPAPAIFTQNNNIPCAALTEKIPQKTQIWDVSDVNVENIDPNRKLIAFTFDDAPAKTLESIVSVFAAFNESNPDCPACATIFCNGHRLTAHGIQLLKAARLLGFEFGNHAYTHTDLTTLTDKQLQWEITRTDQLLCAVDGKATHLFRAPFGNVNERLRSEVQAPIISWTIDTLDWTKKSELDIYDTVSSRLFNGAIVLMHDGYEGTVYALKRLLPDLKARGYQVVSVSQMAKMHRQNLERGKVYIRIRKNGNG